MQFRTEGRWGLILVAAGTVAACGPAESELDELSQPETTESALAPGCASISFTGPGTIIGGGAGYEPSGADWHSALQRPVKGR